MAWINGQWVDDRQVFGGMLGGIGVQPRFEEGYTGDTSLDVIGGPMQPPPFGDRPGMPNLPPQMNPPGYSRGPQMQPPFGGGLGDITQWNPVQTPEWQPALPPGVSVIGEAIGGQPPQMYPPTPPPPRMPAPVPPQIRPPMPPMPPMPPSRPPIAPPGIVRPPVAPPVITRPPVPPTPPVLPPIVDIVRPPRPPSITIADPPRGPKPPKKKVKKVKKVKTKRKPIDQRGYSKGPGGSPTRPIGQKGYTQEGRGPKGRGTLSPIRSGRGRGDR